MNVIRCFHKQQYKREKKRGSIPFLSLDSIYIQRPPRYTFHPPHKNFFSDLSLSIFSANLPILVHPPHSPSQLPFTPFPLSLSTPNLCSPPTPPRAVPSPASFPTKTRVSAQASCWKNPGRGGGVVRMRNEGWGLLAGSGLGTVFLGEGWIRENVTTSIPPKNPPHRIHLAVLELVPSSLPIPSRE